METLSNQILKRTGLNEFDYEKGVFNTFLMCCSEIAKSPQHLQILLINKAFNNWFLMEMKKLNHDFLESTEVYKKLNKTHLAKRYQDYLKRISTKYPSAIINKIKIKTVEPRLLICN